MASNYAQQNAMMDDDIPAMTEEELRNSELVTGLPGSEHVYFAIDGKTFSYFKDTGKGYLNRLNILVNTLLMEYVAQQQKAEEVI